MITILSACLFSIVVAYFILAYNFYKLRVKYQKIFTDIALLEKLINNTEESKIKLDEDVHKENFIKFLSDSRDWAYQYIEDVQAGLNSFISETEPEINYFKEYGDLSSMAPNYYSMKKITEEYEKLKALLPGEEEAK